MVKMDIREIKELISRFEECKSVTEMEFCEGDFELKLKKKIQNPLSGEAKIIKPALPSLEAVVSPKVGRFYYIMVDKNTKELKEGELKKLCSNGNRILIKVGSSVEADQVLGVVVQLQRFPYLVKAPCAGIIEVVQPTAGDGCGVGYKEELFVLRRT